MRESRIVSLIPAATEVVCALGLGDRLVARSHECDYPEFVKALPAITAPTCEPDGTSARIDRNIRSLVERGLSVYRIDEEGLRAAAPDVILTQSQCEVCAASEDQIEAAVAGLLNRRPSIVSLAPRSLEEVWADILRVAAVLGVEEQGRSVVEGLCARIDAIRVRAEALTARPPRVAAIEWIEPMMASGNWVPEMIALAGGESLLAAPGAPSPPLAPDALAEADPDLVLVKPCGFGLARTREEMMPLAIRPDWAGLRATRSGNVYAIDGNQYFNRPGPRLVESVEILAEILHPELFEFGHEGTGWMRAV